MMAKGSFIISKLPLLLLLILVLDHTLVHGLQFDKKADFAYSTNHTYGGSSSSSTTTTTTTTTNTYAQAVTYGQTHPTRDGESWNGWCASLMWRAGNLPESSACPTAIDAYSNSKIISLDYSTAPNGAFHWWDIGDDGHVAMAYNSNGWAMMASCHVTESWGDCIGVTPVTTYTSTTGAKYLGWSYDYANAEIADVHSQPAPVPSPAGSCPAPYSTTQDDGVPGTNYYMRQQCYAAKYGYTGPIDGVLGTNSWKGTQTGMKNYGYTGPIDGVPGTNTYMAMQRLASGYGYQGPIDGFILINGDSTLDWSTGSYKKLTRDMWQQSRS